MIFRRHKPAHRVLQYSYFKRDLNKITSSRLSLQEIELLSYKNDGETDTITNWTVYFRPKLREIAAKNAISIYDPAKTIITQTTTSIKVSTRKQVANGSDVLVGVMGMPKTGLQITNEYLTNEFERLRYNAKKFLSVARDLIHTSFRLFITVSVRTGQAIISTIQFVRKVSVATIKHISHSIWLVAMLVNRAVIRIYKLIVLATVRVYRIVWSASSDALKALRKAASIIYNAISYISASGKIHANKMRVSFDSLRAYISENLVLTILILFILVVSTVTIVQTILFFAQLFSV